MTSVADAADLIRAVTSILWPVIAAVVLFLLAPTLRRVIGTRAFSVKIGTMEVSVQQASVNLAKQITELQDEVNALRRASNPSVAAPAVAEPPSANAPSSPRFRRVLWVDDNPSNNAYEIKKLRDAGLEVVLAESTAKAMETLTVSADGFDAVITDMGRTEDGRYQATAGLTLIKQIRDMGEEKPIFVYAGRRGRELRDQIIEAGAMVPGSSLELFSALQATDSHP